MTVSCYECDTEIVVGDFERRISRFLLDELVRFA